MKLDDFRLTFALVCAALTCGGWAAWPHLFPAPAQVQVTRTFLPPVGNPDPAPTYPSTASIQPLISGLVNVNTASLEQLSALPRIGPALAGRIVAARPYRSLADLDAVKGIGPKLLAQLAPLVRF